MPDRKEQQGVPTYRHAQAPDGTYTIFDVPIFAAHNENRGDRTLEFDAAWLKGALDTSLTRQAEGYLPPLHVRHHGDGSVDAAGKFRPTRLGTISHNGEQVMAMFADLVGVRPEIFQRISRGELSYRSVEILDVNKAEIDSLALLDDEVPFFRFPLLRLEDATDPHSGAADAGAAPVPIVAMRTAGPARYFAALGARSSALFKFNPGEQAMPEPTNQPVTGAAPATDPAKKNASAEQVLMQIFQMLQRAMPALSQQPSAGPGPVEQPAPAMAGGGMMPQRRPMQVGMSQFNASGQGSSGSADDAAQAGANAAVMARMKAMEAELATFKANAAIDTRAADLAAKGFSAEVIQDFRTRAADKGLDHAIAYADAAEQIGAPSLPPAHWTGELRSEAPDAPELAKYAAAGPEKLSEAREFYASWARAKAHGSTLTFDEFYTANADAEGFLAAGRNNGNG